MISRRSIKKSSSSVENNGRTWKTSNLTGIAVNSILGNNGKWVATTQNNGVYYSTDGKNWTQSKLTTGSFGAICCREGYWVVGSLDGTGIFYSSNLNTWSNAYPKTGSFKPGSICAFEGGWYAGVSSGSTIYSSNASDGSSWSGNSSGHGGCNEMYTSLDCCVLAGSAEYATSGSYGIYYRNSGSSSFSNSNLSAPMKCICKAANAWIVGSEGNNGIYYSTGGPNSFSRSNKIDGSISSLFYANGIIVATSNSGTPGIFYSSNGSSWSNSGVITSGAKIVRNACGIWVCGTSEGILFSLNEINWQQTNITNKEITSLCNSNGIWLAAGPDGVYYSELV